MQAVADFRILEEGSAVLGAEGDVHNDAGEGLWHGIADYHAPLGLGTLADAYPGLLVPRSALGWLGPGLWPSAEKAKVQGKFSPLASNRAMRFNSFLSMFSFRLNLPLFPTASLRLRLRESPI